ncbi:hypothetical protein KA005_31700 [bacterium]|nr:hypothetical protein [bacterium]
MDIKINETGELESITLIDPVSGCDWFNDFCGNDTSISYDEDNDVYLMDQENFDWWEDAAERQQKSDEMVEEIKTELTGDAYDEFIEDIGNISGDIGDRPDYVINFCEDFKEEMD